MRLDSALVARGLVDSRTKAQRRIRGGDVTVEGIVVTKTSHEVADDIAIEISGAPDYVGRGALKLLAALEEWDINPSGMLALDIGASTGGFTQVLLERGASRVVAIDVGHDQLHSLLRDDPRVDSFDGTNVRDITRDWWQREVGLMPSLIVSDVSFISLTQIIPGVVEVLGGCDWIALIKPQFEVGKGGVKEGIVTNPELRASAMESVLECAATVGLQTRGLMASPITGESGNQEYLCWLSPTHGRNPPQWSEQIHQLAHS
jgi:23S rRNA (cytidine1920-2'-O)/16S rRNA (cytidine1409-2'-O)-methyltransferase